MADAITTMHLMLCSWQAWHSWLALASNHQLSAAILQHDGLSGRPRQRGSEQSELAEAKPDMLSLGRAGQHQNKRSWILLQNVSCLLL